MEFNCSAGVSLDLLSLGWFLRVARSERPPTRIMNHSLRFESKISQNLRRSKSGTCSSKASSSTRSSKRSQLISRFWVYPKSRSGSVPFAFEAFAALSVLSDFSLAMRASSCHASG